MAKFQFQVPVPSSSDRRSNLQRKLRGLPFGSFHLEVFKPNNEEPQSQVNVGESCGQIDAKITLTHLRHGWHPWPRALQSW